MRIIFVNYAAVVKPTTEGCVEVISTFTSFKIAKELTNLGHEIILCFRGNIEHNITKDGIQVWFFEDIRSKHSKWFIPKRMHQSIYNFMPDIIHIESMIFPLQSYFLYKKLKNRCPFYIQNHAEIPQFKPLAILQYLFFRKEMNFLFTAKGQELMWHKWKILSDLNKTHFVMEGSNDFSYEKRDTARKKTGIVGSPVFIWVGNLKQNKDPLTVLLGFEKVIEQYPKAKFYFIYKEKTLLKEIKHFINQRKKLKTSVVLIGTVEHQKLQDFYNSSDYFISGSHKEGSGYALSESMACGVIPIVTEIPSFIMMTDSGKLGSSWKMGDNNSLAKAIINALNKNLEQESQKVRNFFHSKLSSKSIAKELIKIYQA